MAFSSAPLTGGLSRALHIDDVKVEIQNIACISGDTSGTVTARTLSRVDAVIVAAGLQLSAQPSVSNLSVSLAFADPLASVAGKIILIGK